MSPPIIGKPVAPSPAEACDPPDVHSATWLEMPQSGTHSCKTPEAFLVDLMGRLGGEISLAAATEAALNSLRAYLPNCGVELVDPQCGQALSTASTEQHSESTPSAGGNYHSSTQLLGRCEWPLSDCADGPILTISLPPLRQARDVATVHDIGEHVAILLRAAVRYDHLQQRLVTQTEAFLGLRRRIIQAEKLAGYGQLVASALHDLSNPLTAIVAYADYLVQSLDSKGLDRSDLERLARIRGAAQSVLTQTRRLVEYACPPRAPFVRVDLAEVIHRALSLCEHEFSRAQVLAHSTFSRPLPLVNGHPEYLTQLFVNLFTNAAQAACPSGGRLEIDAGAAEEPARLRVLVRDNGTGIRQCDIDHVFDAFYTTKSGTGSGLGLAIVRDIVEHHGGHISVTSTPLVETTFVLTLPTVPPGDCPTLTTPH